MSNEFVEAADGQSQLGGIVRGRVCVCVFAIGVFI